MIRHHTYASGNMTISASKCSASALRFGCDSSTILGPNNIDSEFYALNRDVLNAERGAGYWLWKPYFLLEQIKRADLGDVLVYTDAGIMFEADIRHVIDEMDSEIMVFGNRWTHGDWCKMDVLKEMACERWAGHEQLQASCIIVVVGEHSQRFAEKWLEWCCKPGFIDDSPSKWGNLQGFREHRHDQAILTNMAFRYGLTFHWWPAQYSLRYKHQYKNRYGVTFQHHRKRNNEW